MIVKIKYENQWTYIADVARVKTEVTTNKNKEITKTPILVGKIYIFYRADKPFEIIELEGNVVYLLTDEGKTIEKIN